MKSRFDIYAIAALSLAFFAFFMSALVSDRVFERLPHLEDEMTYMYQARIFASGAVAAPIPAENRAFWKPFVISYWETGNRFGKYHPGWPGLLAVGLKMGQIWALNGFFAMLTVTLAYRLGREIFGASAGLIAAGLVAFSPMALLLNATLMPHTVSLMLVTAFMYGYWRIGRERRVLTWAALAGIALGFLLIIRPSTAVAVASPFVLWTVLRLLPDLRRPARLRRSAAPFVLLAVCALLFAPIIPLFNYATTGDPLKNLYLEVWEYDRLGFGEDFGVNGHSIAKGVNHARFDLSLTATDLFGWTIQRDEAALLGWRAGDLAPDGPISPSLRAHLLTQARYFPAPFIGLSLFVVLIGVFVGLQRARPLQGLFALTIIWFAYPLATNADFLTPLGINDDYSAIWLWLGVGGVFLLAPAFWLASRRKPDDEAVWVWLLGTVTLALIYIHLAYWVGSQRYSTRYYFEGLTGLALIGALPFVWVIRRSSRKGVQLAVYAVLGIVLVWSLYAYSTPRISVLYQFNRVSQSAVNAIEARREDDRPILIIASGENMVWRSYGTFMAMTDPFFESDIIAAWNHAPDSDLRERLIAQHPERQVIDITFDREDSWFADCPIPRDEACRINPPSPLD